ncbi:MAG: PIN domain-containing protein [Dehalococcoidia bacterium]
MQALMMPAPSLSRRVFVDTAAYFVVANRNDVNHTAAGALLRQLVTDHRRLFTTNYVLTESHALLLIRMGYAVARSFLWGIDHSPSTTIVRVSARDERRARAIIEQYDDKAFSLTDATSFAVMERLGISQAFTFDRNFAQYGFTMLPA